MLLIYDISGENISLFNSKLFSTEIEQKGDNRIVNGITISASNYKWIVALSAQSKNYESLVFCGGTLIRHANPPLVLVCLLLQCYTLTSEFVFYATIGRSDVQDTSEQGYITVPWKDAKYHKYYNSTSFENDIGVIILDYNIQMSQIASIHLFTNDACCNESETVRVLGYGSRETNRAITGYLEYADLSYIPAGTQTIYQTWHDLCVFINKRRLPGFDALFIYLLQFFFDKNPNSIIRKGAYDLKKVTVEVRCLKKKSRTYHKLEL
ncbi:hypothetical protein RFI_13136 [Reticulomyxa filosa]|uniref:Peptidase S1 domain-containing protein n=1 Tax=Reticulomyxa filosa TaxID=46433 RepID=X6NDF9_RETFI|nr:hypothetical protein RFI_13136 [Reticulomyxa filosa]|eukprot:ETO24026.1 hypothetical protein RFI_13136 [Reticulomyxa filosa]